MPTMPNGMKPVVSAYSIGDAGGVRRTETAGGACRYALQFDRGMQQFQVTLMLDALKFSVWTAFYHHVIKKGAITFDMQLDSGFGTETHACNIVPGSYSATRTGGIVHAVVFVVESESKAYEMSAEDAQALIDLYNELGAETDDLLEALAKFATVDSNVLAEV